VPLLSAGERRSRLHRVCVSWELFGEFESRQSGPAHCRASSPQERPACPPEVIRALASQPGAGGDRVCVGSDASVYSISTSTETGTGFAKMSNTGEYFVSSASCSGVASAFTLKETRTSL